MKRQPRTSKPKPRPQSPRGGGAAGSARKAPTPGWKGFRLTGWKNPRTPSVPATLELKLDEYFAAGALMGLVASQVEEPNQQWCRDWSFRMGNMMAREARKRRKGGR